MIGKLKWKLVTVLTAVVSLVLMGVLVTNFLTSRSAIQAQNIAVLRQVGERSSGITSGQQTEVGGIPFVILEVQRTGRIYAVWDGYYDLSETDVAMITEEVLTRNQELGELEGFNFRYYCQSTSLGWRITCTDLLREADMERSLLQISVATWMCGTGLLFLLSLGLATWLVRPVAKAWEDQRQFVADASHELKTPLTVILSSADMLQHQAGDEESHRRWTENIRAEGERMRRLVEDLLQLTRGELVNHEQVRTPVDLSDVAENCAMMLEPAAFDRGTPLMSHIQPNCTVMGDGDALHQLVTILLDNAIKYCAPQGNVVMALQTEGGRWVKLWISNPCPPLTHQECKDIFHRFYRTDQSRTTQPGHGLGLAIAQDLAKKMRGTLWAEHNGTHMMLYLRLPLGRI